jgi:DNA-binding MarR family transcriptional regulator
MSSADMPESVAKRLGYAMKRAQHALRISMDDALRPTGLTAPQYAILCAVEAEAGLSNARLARSAFVTPQTMQGMLANLERDAVIARHPDPANARILHTELTPHGRKVLADAHRLVGRVEEVLVRSFGSEEADHLALALTTCADDLQASLRPSVAANR